MSARYRVLIIHEDVAGSSLNEISAAGPPSPSAPSLQGRTLTCSQKQNKQTKSQVRNHLIRLQSVCVCLCVCVRLLTQLLYAIRRALEPL